MLLQGIKIKGEDHPSAYLALTLAIGRVKHAKLKATAAQGILIIKGGKKSYICLDWKLGKHAGGAKRLTGV